MISSSDLNIRRHIQLYYSKLKTGLEFSVSDLFDSYRQISPTIHRQVNSSEIDIEVLNYCLNRLPAEIYSASKIILAQNRQSLISANYPVNNWLAVFAKSRRRRMFFSSDTQTMALIITSDADIDDIVNILIAIQIEFAKISHQINIDPNFIQKNSNKFSQLLGQDFETILNLIKAHPGFNIKLIDYQVDSYVNLANDWWQNLQRRMIIFGIEDIPVYFVSSNLHSLLNITGGYITAHQPLIYDYLQLQQPDLYQQLITIQNNPDILRKEDFYYFVSSKYLKSSPDVQKKKQEWEQKIGIKNLNLAHDIYCDAQIIPISSLSESQFIDPALIITNKQKLANSKAVIINIDYPLGLTAYLLLSQMLQTLHQLAGVYIVGKAAILQGQVGDVQIPNIVFDERLNNVISFDNIFNSHFPVTSKNFSVLNNQKAISVQGVILENKSQIDNYLKTNFNIIEMESGSYLTAIAQKYNNLGEFSKNQVCRLTNLPFDLGIINYASDNPLSANLGQGPMAMRGIEPTYASLLAIVQRIINLEETK